MNFFSTIKFRFTLWYLLILGTVLTVLGTGIYSTFSNRLRQNLDRQLKIRAEQLVAFRDIMGIVAGGTFEEEPGETVSFYFYSDGRPRDISHKGRKVPLKWAWIDGILDGETGFTTVHTDAGGPIRVYAMPYVPEATQVRLDQSRNRRGGKPERPPPKRREPGEAGRPKPPNPHRLPGSPPPRRGERPPPEAIEVSRAAIVVSRSMGAVNATMDLLFQILMTALPVTIILAGSGGLFLLRRALKPVDEITHAAQEIEESDLSRRIKVNTEDELGRLAGTLNLMIERLQKAFQRQKELTGDASHELRGPLAVIQAEATLALQRERDPESYRKSLEVVANGAEHMSGIIKQLLTLARADSGKEQMTFQTVQPAPFLENLCEDMGILCREKKQILQQNYDEALTIEGDPKALRNMMVNLITNAIRYTPEGGRIAVSMYREKSKAVIAVSDTGIGIPSNELPFIFKRFYRVDKARSREQGGSGLGLAICKHIAEAHSGSIQAESRVNRGSTFRVWLPLALGG